MKQKQRGVSIIEIILILAVVGLLVAVVWLFVQNQKKSTAETATSNTTAEQSTKASPSTAPAAANSPASWYTYQPAGKEYSIKVADGWKLYKKSGDDKSLYSDGGLALSSGTRGQVLDATATNTDIASCGVFVLDYLPYQASDGSKQAFTTDSGISVGKTSSVDTIGVSGGGTMYSYNLTKGNKTLNATYDICKNSADNHDVVEQVIKTIAIN